MLVIKKIKLLLYKLNRYKMLSNVRLGYESSYVNNQNYSFLVDKKIIEWKEDFTLPLYLHKPLQFQFYPKHDFGYSPEQITSVSYGSATIVNFQNKTYEGEVKNSDGQVTGRFAFQFRVMNDKRISENSKIVKTINFTSALAQLDLYYGEKGYYQFRIGSEYVYSPELKVTDNQLLLVQPLVLPIHEIDQDKEILQILIYVLDEPVAYGKLKLFSDKKKKLEKYRKIQIFNKETKEKCGLMFLSFNVQKNKNIISESLPKLPSIYQVEGNYKRVNSQNNLSRVSKNGGAKSVELRRKIKRSNIPLFRIGEYSYNPELSESKYKNGN